MLPKLTSNWIHHRKLFIANNSVRTQTQIIFPLIFNRRSGVIEITYPTRVSEMRDKDRLRASSDQ